MAADPPQGLPELEVEAAAPAEEKLNVQGVGGSSGSGGDEQLSHSQGNPGPQQGGLRLQVVHGWLVLGCFLGNGDGAQSESVVSVFVPLAGKRLDWRPCRTPTN